MAILPRTVTMVWMRTKRLTPDARMASEVMLTRWTAVLRTYSDLPKVTLNPGFDRMNVSTEARIAALV